MIVASKSGPRRLTPAARADLRVDIADARASRTYAGILRLWASTPHRRLTGTLSPRYQNYALAA